jgi:hypothetical protein
MRWALLPQILFIIYCIEAGALFSFVAWTPGWEHAVVKIPFPELRHLCLHPILRSGVTGLGLVHLVWGAHDLDLLLARWRSRGRPPA